MGGCLILVVLLVVGYSEAYRIQTTSFLSPKFVLGPGSVENRVYLDIEFPRGHIAVRSFNAEVIDEAGNPVPLHETYLHHWVVARYYQRKGASISEKHERELFFTTGENNGQVFERADYEIAGNSGICQGNILGQYFGLGSETRKTATYVPDPYGIEIGNPGEIPEGYEEKWMLNVHAIDTRGVEDTLGCTECKCDLYNVTVDEYGRPIRPDYKGGLFCCYDHTQCKVREGFEGTKRSLYLRYTVEWIDWDASVLPVEIYIFDVTDNGIRTNGSTGIGKKNGCRVEYEVESCSSTGDTNNECIDVKKTSLTMPTSGYVIYGVAHQHTGGIGSTLYGQDGHVICTSTPIYGDGKEAGNEEGYIVGMSTCYPKPGSVNVIAGENLILESNYNSTLTHTGVMGLFYILVADRTPDQMPFLHNTAHVKESMKVSQLTWVAVALLSVAIAIGVFSWVKKGREEYGYQQIVVT